MESSKLKVLIVLTSHDELGNTGKKKQAFGQKNSQRLIMHLLTLA